VHIPTCTQQFTGPGLRSKQQLALRLLEILDPELKSKLGTGTLTTGDYKWRKSMMPELMKAIEIKTSKWVIKEAPFGYDRNNPVDMKLWQTRRAAGLKWIESAEAQTYVKTLYNVYATIFAAVTAHHGSSTFVRCLESFFKQRRMREQGDLRDLLQTLLIPLCSSCGCTVDTVVDRMSFVTCQIKRAVFTYFGNQVRNTAKSKPTSVRVKDREDEVSRV
jgi:hypothetical protein